MHLGLASLPLIALLGLVPLVGQADDDDRPEKAKELPAEWRDNRRPELREFWDALEGKPAPPLTGVSHWLQTDARKWEDLRGKVVVLDMWATWCGPCLQGIPKLQDLHKRYSKDGLVILGVHSSRGFEKMRDFVIQKKLNYSFAAYTKRTLGARLGVKYIPSYFVVDRTGTMRVAGADRDKLGEIVKALLAEDRPEPPTTADGWPAIVQKELYAEVDLRGQNAPPFKVQSWLTGEPDRTGKVVLIDFWATWCPPCRKAIPELGAWQKTFADDLVVIGVSDEDADTVREFMSKNRMGYAQAVDPRGTMKNLVGVDGIPHVLLIDSNGVVRWQGFPFDPSDPLTEDVVRSVIELDRAARAE